MSKNKRTNAFTTHSSQKKIEILNTSLKQAQRQAELGEQALVELQKAKQTLLVYRLIFQHASDAIMITDATSKIIDLNNAFTKITGFSREEILHHDPKVLASGKHNASFFKKMWDTLNKRGHWQGEIWNRKKSGEIFPEWLSITAIYKENKKDIEFFLGIFTDITKRKEKEQKLEKFAYYDPLTGLLNRRASMIQLDSILDSAKRQSEQFAVAFMDLDKFKQVNDEYGHLVGDGLLIEVGKRIKNCLRQEDLCARMGGDEFLVVIREIQGASDAYLPCQNILNAIQKPFKIAGHDCEVGMSIGICLYPSVATEAQRLLEKADQAMYDSKEKGRNCITVAK